MSKKRKEEISTTISVGGGPEMSVERFAKRLRAAISTGGVMTVQNLLETVQELRTLTIMNSRRIKRFRPIADKFGQIETIILENYLEEEDKQQEKLPLDKPDSSDFK